ncbi:hypothetical protein [Kribbella sp. CA-293567]|uniref:hypothetical protein n=1 Tax=Kribbella sp. CA-293567 TaxID=3002436 RepID=UPI0022DD45D8|nr:hypothetical protein [Kribbella sp. CA-293567]WBQ07320.1 hypothetical protein OX958_11050 [Kribbella sp. CA-293567]
MDSYRPPATPELENRRTTASYRVFFGWLGLEVLAYALAAVFASDESDTGCTGLCFTDQEMLVFLAMLVGAFVLGGQVIVGMLLTRSFHRHRLNPFAAGTASYFLTVLLAAVVLVSLAVVQ